VIAELLNKRLGKELCFQYIQNSIDEYTIYLNINVYLKPFFNICYI